MPNTCAFQRFSTILKQFQHHPTNRPTLLNLPQITFTTCDYNKQPPNTAGTLAQGGAILIWAAA
jgi:hypothetical protein